MSHVEYNRIIEKLKRSLDKVLEKLYEELKEIENNRKLQKELSEIESLEMLTYLDTSEIIKYMSAVDPNYQIDPVDLETSIYFYSKGKENTRFQTSPRYEEAAKKLQAIKDKFDEYAKMINATDRANELAIRNNIIIFENLYNAIGVNNKISGEIEELEIYSPIFDESWTEEERITLYSILVKAHIENLINTTTQHLEEFEEIKAGLIDKKADEVEAEIASRIADKDFTNAIETSKQGLVEIQPVENTHRVEVSEEIKNNIKELKTLIKKHMGTLSHKLTDITRASYGILKNNYEKSRLTLQALKENFIPSDFKLFLTYCIYTEVSQIEELISGTHKEEDIATIKELINESLKICANYAKIFADEERGIDPPPQVPTVPSEKESPMKIIFYPSPNGESEFEKSMKNLSKGKIEGIVNLLSKLEQDNIRNATILAKGNSSKLKYISNYNVFITFKLLPNNHILVFHVADIDEINKKTTNTKLNTFDFRIEQSLSEIIIDGTRFPEGTTEYRKLMSENKARLKAIKEKAYGTKRGGSRV